MLITCGILSVSEFCGFSIVMDNLLRIFLIVGPLMSQARIISSPRQPRLSLAESMPSYYYTNIDGKPGTYSFGYDVQGSSNGNNQYRTEDRYSNGTVVGSYGYVGTNGKLYRYNYIADERGYRVVKMKDDVQQSRPQQNNQWTQSVQNPSAQEVTWSRKKNSSNNKYRIAPKAKPVYRQDQVYQTPIFYYS